MEKMKKIEIVSLITTIICGMIAGTLMYDTLSSCVLALIMKSSYSGLIGRMYNEVVGDFWWVILLGMGIPGVIFMVQTIGGVICLYQYKKAINRNEQEKGIPYLKKDSLSKLIISGVSFILLNILFFIRQGAPICLYSLPLLLIVILMILNLAWIKKEL